MPANAVRYQPAQQPTRIPSLTRPERPVASPFHPAPKLDPTYHPVGSLAASPRNADLQVRK
jgi:hypothetical protein